MEFASSALSTLLPKLARLLQNEYNLQKAVREDIQSLSTELEAIHAALEKVSQVPIEELDKVQKIWAQNVRDLSYDMEDVFDKFILRIESPDPPGKRSIKKFFKKMMKNVTKVTTRHEIADEIKDIKKRLREVAEQRDRNTVNVDTPAKTTYDPRITTLYKNVSELVGIGEAKEEVKLRMFTNRGEEKNDEQHKRRIVSIAGFGGLGKTTLAKAVYNEIKGKFDCTAFVCVSRNPNTQKLLKDMLYELDKDIPDANLDERQLVDRIREFLQNKRYLIVIDDIWDREPWKIIECALLENNKKSGIITTTRNVDVAKHVGGYYKLKPLSNESSEKLFYGRVFGSIDKCPENFSEISRKILKKCGGVPLAIITMASLLANKSNNIQVWNDVFNSIGSGLLGSNPDMHDMKKILLLSYYDLPYNLKACLLYLSMFPEDYKIPKDQLIWRWVAEGFVQKEKGDQSFLEIGESYFNKLLNRSLIQPARMYEDGTPEACHVHDTVLDLMVSLSKEECFIGTVSGDEKHSLDSKVRRISLLDYTTCRPAMMDMPTLRSLAIFKHDGAAIYSMPSLSCYQLLRVLDLRGCELKDLASLGFVGSLSYLRYLGISTTDFDDSSLPTGRLPVEIGKLRFLQTLDFSQTMVGELPSSIIELRQLMCLCAGGRNKCVGPTTLPDGLKNLTSLEVLKQATVKSEGIAGELGYLTQLRVLEVGISEELLEDGPSNKDDQEHGLRACIKALVASIGKLKRLESLKIWTPTIASHVYLDGSMDEPLGNLQRLSIYSATVLPSWIKAASLPVLSYLDIEVETERREDIQVLGTLRCLRHLEFTVMSTSMQALERCQVGPDAFPCVESCEICFNSRAKGSILPSVFPRGAMPRLQHFEFTINLEHLCISTQRGVGLFSVDDDLGLGLAHLPSLRTVSASLVGTRKVSQEVVNSVKEKLKHEASVHPNNPRIDLKDW